MTSGKTDIWVYAHWKGMTEPKCMGILSAHQGKGRKSFSFEYDLDWIESEAQQLLDPDIGWYSGAQFPGEKDNFGIILDSMPDRWGRTLLKRRAAILAMDKGELCCVGFRNALHLARQGRQLLENAADPGRESRRRRGLTRT